MTFEMIYGMNVVDDVKYQQYRESIAPLLAEHGGGFRYDFVVSHTLKSEATHPINRVFAIYFPTREQKDAFFANPAYKQVRAALYVNAVNGSTMIAEYER